MTISLLGKRLLIIASLFVLIMPVPVSAQSSGFLGLQGPIFPERCKCTDQIAYDGSRIQTAPDFACALQVAQNVLNFIVSVGVVVMTFWVAYAGWNLVVSAGNPKKIQESRERFLSIAVGLLVLLGAWLAVDFVMKTLYREGSFGPWNAILADSEANYCIVSTEPRSIVTGTLDVIFGPPGATNPAPNAAPGTVTTTGGCRNGQCVRLSVPCEASGCSIDANMGSALSRIPQPVNASVGWAVTEAYPPSRKHKDKCHAEGTCVDVSLRPREYSVENIISFQRATSAAGMRAVFEDLDCSRVARVNAAGGRALCLPGWISAPHFSVYPQ